SADYLFFRVPLQGDFEVECEVTAGAFRTAELAYGGRWLALDRELKALDLFQVNQPRGRVTLEQPLKDLGEWYTFRLEVKDGGVISSINGRKIHEEALPSPPDPWLALHVASTNTGGLRNLKIKGSPVIPERLDLAAAPDLTGWTA